MALTSDGWSFEDQQKHSPNTSATSLFGLTGLEGFAQGTSYMLPTLTVTMYQ